MKLIPLKTVKSQQTEESLHFPSPFITWIIVKIGRSWSWYQNYMLTFQSRIMMWALIQSNQQPHLEPCHSESSDWCIPVSLWGNAHSCKLWNSQNMGQFWPLRIRISSLQTNYGPNLILQDSIVTYKQCNAFPF